MLSQLNFYVDQSKFGHRKYFSRFKESYSGVFANYVNAKDLVGIFEVNLFVDDLGYLFYDLYLVVLSVSAFFYGHTPSFIFLNSIFELFDPFFHRIYI